jgi:hypothetical protein
LPSKIVFAEGYPFDHCPQERFAELIKNNKYTELHDYSYLEDIPGVRYIGENGTYYEVNNSWYVSSHMGSHGNEVRKYFWTFNEMLDVLFENPDYPNYVGFSPGGQHLVMRDNILFYSKNFWNKIMEITGHHRLSVESHMVERCLSYIFTNKWKEKQSC